MADKPEKPQTEQKPATKEKLRSIMEAASALTALGEEEGSSSPAPATDDQGDTKKDESKPSKRYIPDHKKPDAALTFPEKLMNLMRFAEDQEDDCFCIAWLPDGKSFVIRQPDEFTRTVLPKFFKATKFSSFTRKLYRWGFRQVNRGIGPDDPIIFGNEHFQRDNAEDMSKMRSITAASSRKAEAHTMVYGGGKRALDTNEIGPDHHKRALLDHFLQQKAATASFMNPAGATPVNMYNFTAANAGAQGGQVSLTNALRPSLGLGMGGSHGGPFSGGLPAMMSKHMDFLGGQQSQQYTPNNTALMNSFSLGPTMNGANQGHHQQQPQQGYSNATSTADIVNAAISALRYAS